MTMSRTCVPWSFAVLCHRSATSSGYDMRSEGLLWLQVKNTHGVSFNAD